MTHTLTLTGVPHTLTLSIRLGSKPCCSMRYLTTLGWPSREAQCRQFCAVLSKSYLSGPNLPHKYRTTDRCPPEAARWRAFRPSCNGKDTRMLILVNKSLSYYSVFMHGVSRWTHRLGTLKVCVTDFHQLSDHMHKAIPCCQMDSSPTILCRNSKGKYVCVTRSGRKGGTVKKWIKKRDGSFARCGTTKYDTCDRGYKCRLITWSSCSCKVLRQIQTVLTTVATYLCACAFMDCCRCLQHLCSRLHSGTCFATDGPLLGGHLLLQSSGHSSQSTHMHTNTDSTWSTETLTSRHTQSECTNGSAAQKWQSTPQMCMYSVHWCLLVNCKV